MPVTNYDVADGRIRGEYTGSVSTDYLTDALGSVTGTVDATSAVVNTYRAKPYGGRLAKTGTGVDPVYEWAGATGSRKTGLAFAEQFYERQFYGSKQGVWTSLSRMSRGGSGTYDGGQPTSGPGLKKATL